MDHTRPAILNKRTDPIPAAAVYVGRPSPWGNPFTVPQHGRLAACRRYLALAVERTIADGPEWLAPLAGHDLICWCHPLPCHAEALARLANAPDPVALAHHWRAQLALRQPHEATP